MRMNRYGYVLVAALVATASLVIAQLMTLQVLTRAHASQNVLEEPFELRVVTTGLEYPWEMTWGPDAHLWVTERTAKRVTRVDPVTGMKTVAVTTPEAFQSIAQDGLLGLALHPRLQMGTGDDFVYVAFTYLDNSRSRLKVRRYSYDGATETLASPVDLMVGLPAHDDHLGGRLLVGPDEKLYLTIGDQGGNWLQNYCNPIRAQELPSAADIEAGDWTRYQGKILRVNLDGSIPSDNPSIGGVRSHIYSYGHRNPQGLAFGTDGTLYASEHGPSTDDELNLVEPGNNYGWPRVAGYQDDLSYVYANWSASSPVACATLVFNASDAPPSVPAIAESAWRHPRFQPPLQTFFTVFNEYDFEASGGATIAPSSLAIYTVRDDGIPGWADSLLVPGMIKGRLYRQPLAMDGRSVGGEPVELFRAADRYRDLAIHPNGQTIYVATDNAGVTMGRTGEMTRQLEHPGAILQFTYRGSS